MYKSSSGVEVLCMYWAKRVIFGFPFFAVDKILNINNQCLKIDLTMIYYDAIYLSKHVLSVFHDRGSKSRL